MAVLVIAQHDNARLAGATYNTITAAAMLGGDVHILVAGSGAGAVTTAAAAISGIATVLWADGESLRYGLAEVVCAQVLAIARNYTHLVFPATAWGKGIAPRVAARLDSFQVSEITAVVSPDTFERPIYAGNLIATVQNSDAIKVLTVRAAAFAAASPAGGNAVQESMAAVPDSGKSQFIRLDSTPSERPELSAATVVVSGGRSREKFDEIILPLADKLGAAVGASRAAVDAGFAPNDLQVGQTGKIVAPQLYIAIGISGAVQHLAGMKDSKVIVAINNDPTSPIFEIADYCLEADLFSAVPQLLAAL